MPSCFAPGCTSGYRNDAAGHHFFAPPRNPTEFKRWEQALHRKDRRLTGISKVCERHFESDDIVKYYKHTVNEQELLIPRGKWELAPGAIPRLFPGLPERISKPKLTCRRKSPGKSRALATVLSETCGDAASCGSDTCVDGAAETAPPPYSSDSRASGLRLDDLTTATRPSTNWRLELIDDESTGRTCGVFYMRHLVAGQLQVTKTVVIDEDGRCVINGYNKHHKQLLRTATDVTGIENLLAEIDTLNICSGISGNPTEQVRTSANVHHKHCSVFSNQPVCVRCLRLQRQIRTRKPLRPTPKKSNKMRNLTKRVLRARAARQKEKQEILALREKLSKTPDRGVEEALTELPPLQRLAFMTSFKQLKAKSACVTTPSGS
ncbi:unnamed protein product [Ixodes hexagonus]